MDGYSYPHATKELVPLQVTGAGEPTTDYVVVILPYGEDPADDSAWAAPATAGEARGVMIDHLARGQYAIWARASANPETPVVELGMIAVY